MISARLFDADPQTEGQRCIANSLRVAIPAKLWAITSIAAKCFAAPPPATQPAPAAVVPLTPAPGAAASANLQVGETYSFVTVLKCAGNCPNFTPRFDGGMVIVGSAGASRFVGKPEASGNMASAGEISIEQNGDVVEFQIGTDRGKAASTLNRVKLGEYVGSGQMSYGGGRFKGPAKLIWLSAALSNP